MTEAKALDLARQLWPYYKSQERTRFWVKVILGIAALILVGMAFTTPGWIVITSAILFTLAFLFFASRGSWKTPEEFAKYMLERERKRAGCNYH